MPVSDGRLLPAQPRGCRARTEAVTGESSAPFRLSLSSISCRQSILGPFFYSGEREGRELDYSRPQMERESKPTGACVSWVPRAGGGCQGTTEPDAEPRSNHPRLQPLSPVLRFRVLCPPGRCCPAAAPPVPSRTMSDPQLISAQQSPGHERLCTVVEGWGWREKSEVLLAQ